MEAGARASMGLGYRCPTRQEHPYLRRLTFFANQTPLAWVTHSREWMPVSIQMAGRLFPPVLNWMRRAGNSSGGALSHLLEGECTPTQRLSALWYLRLRLCLWDHHSGGMWEWVWTGILQSSASCPQLKLGTNNDSAILSGPSMFQCPYIVLCRRSQTKHFIWTTRHWDTFHNVTLDWKHLRHLKV